MDDPLFGEIDYKYGWVGKCSWTIIGRTVSTRLSIPGQETDEITPAQREAFKLFEEHKQSICELAGTAIFQYYKSILPDCRERFGEFADEWAPEISALEEINQLIEPTAVIIQQSFANPPERVVGLLFDCTWDTSLGLAVKFINERLSGVGPQDIVL